MNKDKQIEEMCEVLRKNAASCQTCVLYAEGFCIGNCELAEDNQTVCETLYNAGYSKASEVAREIFEAFREEMRSLIATSKELFNECEDDYYEGKKDAFFTAIIHLDELIKKKYTEDGE